MRFHFTDHVSAPYINVLFTIDLYINNFVEYKIFPFHKIENVNYVPT
jgi:hypothetical protein